METTGITVPGPFERGPDIDTGKSFRLISSNEGRVVLRARDTDLDQIFGCGQCFRWKKSGDSWRGVAGGRSIEAAQHGEEITLTGIDAEQFETFWRGYFDFDTDYSLIKETLRGKDGNLARAVDFGGGIRILRQEPFETLISFIISANNNIPRISKCVESLCRAYGEKAVGLPVTEANGAQEYYAFPTPEALAAASPEDISELTHAGYRCPYIVNASKRYIETGGDLTDPESYPGVGPKVAACIRLFTGADMNSFPVDVWVRRLIGELYFGGTGAEAGDPGAAEVRRFVSEHFTEYGGYAQQYLFYWRRSFD